MSCFQGGVQESGLWILCVGPATAARHLTSSKCLLQLHRKLPLPQHVSDGHRQPRRTRLDVPGAPSSSVLLRQVSGRAGFSHQSKDVFQSLVSRPAQRWWCPCAQMGCRTCLNPRGGTSRPSLMSVTPCLGSGHGLIGPTRSTGGRRLPLTATSSSGKCLQKILVENVLGLN